MKLSDLPPHIQARLTGHKVRQRSARPEQSLQIGIFNQLTPLMIHQKFSQFLCFHVGNGGWRSEAEAGIFKSMGVMPGVADIVMLFPKSFLDKRKLTNPDDWFFINAPKTAFIELKFKAARKPPRLKKDGTYAKQRLRREDSGQSEYQKLFQARVEALGFEYHLVEAEDLNDALKQIYKIMRDNGVTGI